jgi:S-adenosylmethionine:tRNA ribosyltransferase-isomerase
MAVAVTPRPVPVDPAGVHFAGEPPEARGLPRDGVRLLVATPRGITHSVAADLAGFLQPGDLVVVNTSATIPAAVDGIRQRDGRPLRVHLSTELPDGAWAAELRPGRRATGPLRDVRTGDIVELPAGGLLSVLAAHPDPAAPGSRLWQCALDLPDELHRYLATYGRPIAYDYVPEDWPLASYQTVFAREPGSAEMPSAGRPLSQQVVTDLVAAGSPWHLSCCTRASRRRRKASRRWRSPTGCRPRPHGW